MYGATGSTVEEKRQTEGNGSEVDGVTWTVITDRVGHEMVLYHFGQGWDVHKACSASKLSEKTSP